MVPGTGGTGTQEVAVCPDSLMHPHPERSDLQTWIKTLLPAKLSVLLLHPAWLDKSCPQSRNFINQPGKGSLEQGWEPCRVQLEHLFREEPVPSPGALAVNMCSLVNTEHCRNENLTVLLLQLLPVESPIQSQIKILLLLLSGELQKHLQGESECLGYFSVMLLCRRQRGGGFLGEQELSPPVLSGETRQASPPCRYFHRGFPH